MRPIILPYKFGSGSARALSEGLRARGHRAKRVRHEGNYRPFRNHLIINWGSSVRPSWMVGIGYHWLNDWVSVGEATNKLIAFQKLQEAGVQIPEFTTDRAEAMRWIMKQDSHGNYIGKVLARVKLQGHSGEGIHLYCGDSPLWDSDELDLVRAPLYVKYIKKTHEYRIHVFGDQVIDIQQKRRRREVPDEQVNWQVRNYQNGFTYSRHDIDPPEEQILEQSRQAVRALTLDFGAVDVIWNSKHQRAYVLEVNTAPGLEGTTLEKYIHALESVL